jgi:hypothetical protein
MRKITLICSLHNENGVCTVDALLKILRGIDPQVIFGEVLPSDRSLYEPRSLEGQAVARFRTLKPSCECVCVDQYDIPPNFRATMDRVFEYVDEANREYQQLFEQMNQATNQQGFGYLNSDGFTVLMARMLEIEDDTINRSGNPALLHGLALWRQAIQGRDKAMVENIERYCSDHAFERAVFLVGAAHKSGVVKKIEESPNSKAGLIEWQVNFSSRDRHVF